MHACRLRANDPAVSLPRAAHQALPQSYDGGVAAAGAFELLSSLAGRTELPTSEEWALLLKANSVPLRSKSHAHSRIACE